MPCPPPATWSCALKMFLVSEAKVFCDQHLSRLHLIPNCGLGLKVSDLLPPLSCPPTGPAYFASSLGEGGPRSKF